MTVNGIITDRISTLRQRAETVQAKLDNLLTRRRQIAPQAADDDKAAVQKINQLDDDADRLLRELTTLRQATEAAVQEHHEKLAETERQEQQERAHQARTLSDAILALSAEADGQLAHLSQTLDRRADLLGQLARIAPSSAASMLARKFTVNAAIHAAQLARHFEVGHVAPNHIRTLLDAASALRKHNNEGRAA